MSDIYSAMLKAAKGDPEKLKLIETAKENNTKRAIEEARQAELAQIKKEKDEADRRAKEAAMQEKLRREKEQQLMATCIPYIFSFPFMGTYSCRTILLLAKDLNDAREKAWGVIKEFMESNFFDDYTKEAFERLGLTKETLPITQIDLSDGMYTVSEHYE